MGEHTSFTIQKTIKAPAADIYYHVTNATGFREWMCDGGVTQVQPGGFILLWWNQGFTMQGQFQELEENERASFSWQGSTDPQPTTVDITLAANGDSTAFSLTHKDIPTDWEGGVDLFKSEWERSLENLKSVMEEGDDVRVSRRPMLGIVPGAIINEDNADDYDLPQGISGNELTAVLDGLSAQSVGLKVGDIIHSLDGIVIDNFNRYAEAIGGKSAGDELEVVYYRQGEKHTVTMPLSPRWTPDVPDDPAKLAGQVRAIFDKVEEELAAILDGVSDEAASVKSGEDNWSAKDVLCHLILGERGTQSFYGSMVTGTQQINGVGNIQAMHRMLMSVYPTLDDLRAELSRAYAQTVALLENLPEEFIATRKATYQRMGQGALISNFHPESHYAQIKAALE